MEGKVLKERRREEPKQFSVLLLWIGELPIAAIPGRPFLPRNSVGHVYFGFPKLTRSMMPSRCFCWLECLIRFPCLVC